MASVSLVSSPPAPVLDKNMTDSELAGDERSSNIIQFLIRSICAIQCCWVYMLVWLVFLSLTMNCRVLETTAFPPFKKIFACLFVQIRLNAVKKSVDFLFLSSPSSTGLTHDHFHAKIAELIVSVVVSVGWIHGFILLPSAGGYTNDHDVNTTPIFVLLLPLQATRQYCQPGFTQGWPSWPLLFTGHACALVIVISSHGETDWVWEQKEFYGVIVRIWPGFVKCLAQVWDKKFKANVIFCWKYVEQWMYTFKWNRILFFLLLVG